MSFAFCFVIILSRHTGTKLIRAKHFQVFDFLQVFFPIMFYLICSLACNFPQHKLPDIVLSHVNSSRFFLLFYLFYNTLQNETCLCL